MSEPNDTSSARSPATWTLIVFWFAWCLGPGVFFVMLVPPRIVSGLTNGEWETEDYFTLAAIATAALVTAALGLMREGPRRRLEFWLLVLFFLAVVGRYARFVPSDVSYALGLTAFIAGVLVPCVAFARRIHTLDCRDRSGHAWDQFMYVAWFRDHQFPPDDQDAEWPACIVIRAPSASDAQAWGDRLAKDMCARKPQEAFLWSRVDMRDDPMYSEQAWAEGREIRFGQWASDKEIGW